MKPAALTNRNVSLSVDYKNVELWGFIAPEFVSFTMDWWSNNTVMFPSWGNSSVLNANLESPVLLNLANELSPSFLRIGGSQADTIFYQMMGGPCYWAQHCLLTERWDQILQFAKAIGARIVFTLNYLSHTTGKPISKKDSKDRDTHDWNSTNARHFLEYTYHHAPAGLLYGVELGNELTLGDKATNMTRMVVAYQELRSVIDSIWRGDNSKPYVMGPASTGGNNFRNLIKKLGPSLDIATYHKYHSKSSDALAKSAIQPSFFSHPGHFIQNSQVASEYLNKKSSFPLWIGEGAMSYNSGITNVTDSFLSSLWYANLLGALSKTRPLSHSVYCRQALVGGNYELINHVNLKPNPDYWIARLYKETVGLGSIGPIQFKNHKKYNWHLTQGCCKHPSKDTLLAHAFCSHHNDSRDYQHGDMTLVMINLSGTTRYSVHISAGKNRSDYTVTADNTSKETAAHLTARHVRINGHSTTADGSLPPPLKRNRSQSVVLEPYSLSFSVVHDARAKGCMDLYEHLKHQEPDFMTDENTTAEDLAQQPRLVPENSAENSTQPPPLEYHNHSDEKNERLSLKQREDNFLPSHMDDDLKLGNLTSSSRNAVSLKAPRSFETKESGRLYMPDISAQRNLSIVGLILILGMVQLFTLRARWRVQT